MVSGTAGNKSQTAAVLIQIALALFGVFNLVTAGIYFVSSWRDLHRQGIGHLYLTLFAGFTFWWLAFAFALCFAGNAFYSNGTERSLGKRLLYGIVGGAIGAGFPPMILGGWFITAVLLRRLL